MRTRAATATGIILALTLSACSGDPESADPSEPSGSGSSSTTSSPATVEPTPSDPSGPTVEPASGPEMVIASADGPLLRVNLPAGAEWSVSGDYASADVGTDGYVVAGDGNTLAPGKGLDYYADQSAELIGDPVMKRQPDRTVNGVPGYVIAGTGDQGYVYEFGAVLEDASVSLQFAFPDDTARSVEWIESVLASAVWV